MHRTSPRASLSCFGGRCTFFKIFMWKWIVSKTLIGKNGHREILSAELFQSLSRLAEFPLRPQINHPESILRHSEFLRYPQRTFPPIHHRHPGFAETHTCFPLKFVYAHRRFVSLFSISCFNPLQFVVHTEQLCLQYIILFLCPASVFFECFLGLLL